MAATLYGLRPGVIALAAALALAIVVWSSVTLYTDQLRFAVFAPQAHVAVVVATASARLFGALVLSMFVTERHGDRLLWVAAGLFVSGVGGLVLQYKNLLFGSPHDPNVATYESLLVWIMTAALFVVGLVMKNPPRLTRSHVAGILAGCVAAGFVAHEFGAFLPHLIANPEVSSLAYEATGWNWVVSMVPLGLAVAATFGAASLYRSGHPAGWLLVAMVLLTGSQLRAVFQPTAYSTVITTADFLHLGFAAVVALGGILKLRLIAAERENLLSAEKETNHRLEELGVMKADFTAMVAHELNGPLSAVRNLSDMLSCGELSSVERKRVLDEIQSQTDSLNALVEDVRTSGSVERGDFHVEMRPTPLDGIIAGAASFHRTLPGERKLIVDSEVEKGVKVLADSGRIGQVLRNLISNAAKHSPAGADIELRATAESKNGKEFVRIEVADRGFGVHPGDVARIFEKFGRGRDASGGKVPGAGLGLYLSRRIVRRHGGGLSLESTSGEGSVFAFELERDA
ncbi:MAG: HAMP domain-containing histidine kinase [Actinomycetota bacterium]|jgi:signal transduction histidine kinase|nr:HAMP domain-containing histidine kinase [Rubrobacter sp.]MDQ3507953.1 HAMP domain-containing histidine kinase [Actinomycetota bacterium]